MDKNIVIEKISEAISLLDGVRVAVHNDRKLMVVAVEDLLAALQELSKAEEKEDGKTAKVK